MPSSSDETHPQTTASKDVTEAFLRLCEALGIPATALAYLEAPRILSAAEARGVQRAVQVIEGGRFLHDDAPAAVFAHEVVAAIRRDTA